MISVINILKSIYGKPSTKWYSNGMLSSFTVNERGGQGGDLRFIDLEFHFHSIHD